MTSQFYLHLFLSVFTVSVQNIFSPSDYWSDNVDLKSFPLKGCETITTKQGDYNIVGKIGKHLPKECVNNVKLEKDGEIYCISGRGDDKLECKENQGNRSKTIHKCTVEINNLCFITVENDCKCGVSTIGGLFQNQGTVARFNLDRIF